MQQFTIDISNPTGPLVLHTMQGDAMSRFFAVTVTDNGAAYTPPDGAIYTVRFGGASGMPSGWYDTITEVGGSSRPAVVVSDNVYTVEIAEQALSKPGKNALVIIISDATGYTLASWAFELDVNATPGLEAPDVATYYNLLAQQVAQVIASTGAAASSAAAAAQSATAAQNSATAAAQSQSAAAKSASTAQTAAQSAQQSATQAAASESAAAQSATSAAEDASSAASDAQGAASSASAAEESKTAAAQSATQAASSASAAAQSASGAKSDAAAAAQSAKNAETSATAAGQSKTAAATSASQAQQSATAASQSAAQAKQAADSINTSAFATASQGKKADTAVQTVNEKSGTSVTLSPQDVGGVSLYTCSTSGKVHTLTGSGDNIKFVADAAYTAGNTIKVNGTTVTAQTQDGMALPTGAWAKGATVVCWRNGTKLTVGGSKAYTPPAYRETWIDGKPIYRKVYTGGALNKSTIDLGVNTQIDSILRADFVVVNSTGNQITNPGGFINNVLTAENAWTCSVNFNNTTSALTAIVTAGASPALTSWTIILHYTKK